MQENPYEPPKTPGASPPAKGRARRELLPRPVVRAGVGFMGGMYISCWVWVLAAVGAEQHWLAELLIFPSFVLGGIAAGWAAFASFVPLRVVAWASAGLGSGLFLDALLAGGLGLGTVVTPSCVVLGFVFAVVGLRASPVRDAAPAEFRVIYHVGGVPGMKTRGRSGRVVLTDDGLSVAGPFGFTVAFPETRGVEVFRQHGIGTLIKVQTSDTAVFMAVPRLNFFGMLAIINRSRTIDLFDAIEERRGSQSQR